MADRDDVASMPGGAALHMPQRTAPAATHRHSPARPGVLAAIAAGGALGAPARYAIATLLPATPAVFPWATFCTNVSGSFVLGFVLLSSQS